MDSKLLELAMMFIFSGILSLTVNKITNIQDENVLQKSKWPAEQNKLIKSKSWNLILLGYLLLLLGVVFLILFLIILFVNIFQQNSIN